MRINGFVAFIAALALGQGAQAAVLTGTMTTNNSGQIFPGVDYTIPSDGVTYRWDFFTDSAHPNAIITLGGPNDVYSTGRVSNGDGTTHIDFNTPAPNYVWNASYAPGHTTIFVGADPSFNNCSGATPAGVLCGVSNFVFGDSAPLSVDVKDVVTITFSAASVSGFSATAIPEPAAWALMLAGVFGVGAALRQRRRMLREAQPSPL